MITLYGFGAGFGLPEISPFVTKTEVQLRMAGLAYRKERAMPPASPKGQLPFIEDEAERIGDSTFIRAHLEGKYGFDFDAPLSLQQRAQAWAFERMIEHHVYWALVGARWVDPENFAKGPALFFDRVPDHRTRRVLLEHPLVHPGGVAEAHRPEAQPGHVQAGVAELHVLHVGLLSSVQSDASEPLVERAGAGPAQAWDAAQLPSRARRSPASVPGWAV